MSRRIGPILTALHDTLALGQVTANDFAPHLDTPFVLTLEDGPEFPLRLTEVSPGTAHPGFARSPFTLIFTGTPGIVLPQQIYALCHGTMGKMEIFLVPIGATPQETTYQAVFN